MFVCLRRVLFGTTSESVGIIGASNEYVVTMVTGASTVNVRSSFDVWRCHSNIGNWPISLLEIL